MDLPTYTSIWRIEKRLYKLYDFRLPMPVPVGQIAVFAAITVPYVILLTVLGIPFSHTLFWLYVLPPGVVTWLATRPVLESKRLPELVMSQGRYLGEPSTWCRMAPLAEKDEIAVTGRVWRKRGEARPVSAGQRRASRATPAPALAPSLELAPGVELGAGLAAAAGPAAGPSRARAPGQAASAGRARAPGQAASAGRARAAGGVTAGQVRAPGQAAAPGGARVTGQAGAPRRARSLGPATVPRPPVQARALPAEPAASAPRFRERAEFAPRPELLEVSHDGTAETPATLRAFARESAVAGEGVAAEETARGRGLLSATRDPGPDQPTAGSGRAWPEAFVHGPAPAEAAPPASFPAEPSPPGPAAQASSPAAPAPPVPPGPGPQAPAWPARPARGHGSVPAAREAAAGGPPALPHPAEPTSQGLAAQAPSVPAAAVPQAPAWPDRPAQGRGPVPAGHATPVLGPPAPTGPAVPAPARPVTAAPEQSGATGAAETPGPATASAGALTIPAQAQAVSLQAATAPAKAAPAPPPEAPAAPPPTPVPTQDPPPAVVVVRGGPAGGRPARLVERALSGPAEHRSGSWRDHVRVVPGGHGPGRPDMEKRDRARVLLPIQGSRMIVVLGCTVGAGQTVTTLMIADLLASLRSEQVAALDLNPGRPSLTDMAHAAPTATVRGLLAGSAPGLPGPRGRARLDVVAHDVTVDGEETLGDLEYGRIFDILAAHYSLTVADPGASAVARVLAAADQLVLVAPASPDAARAVAMTQEWLDAHGYGGLSAGSVTVINGVSKRSMAHVEQAEVVVRGRCRAIVRVPWDDHLGAPETEQGIRDCRPVSGPHSRLGQLRPPVLHAYTALAGVLVGALAASPEQRRALR